jgi:hypothetical protein
MSIGDKKLMTKKKWKEKQKKYRVVNGFNTGTRDMKTEKLPTRAMDKEKMREMIKNVDSL